MRWWMGLLVLLVLGCERPGAYVEEAQNVGELTEVRLPGVPEVVRDANGNLMKLWGRNAQASVYSKADVASAIVRPIRLGSLLYLFTPGPGEEWMSAGSDPRGRPDGFVRHGDVITTPTMQVAKFLRETRNVRRQASLFADPETLVGWMETGDATRFPAAFVEADFPLGEGELWANPLLEVKEVAIGDQRIRIAKIATFTWNKNVRDASDVTVAQAAAVARKLDLLLVIDATASMRIVIQKLREYLCAALESLEKTRGLDVNVALCLYRDYDADSAWTIKPGALRSDFASISARLDDVEAAEGGSWDEALFDGLYDGIEGAGWRDGSYRMAIVAANNASHGPNDAENPRSLTAEKVISIAKQNRVVICSLQVPQDPRDDSDPARLTKQLQALADGTGGTARIVTDVATLDTNGFGGRLAKLCDHAGERVSQQVAMVKAFATGDDAATVRSNLAIPSVVFEDLKGDLTERLGVDPARLSVGDGAVGFESAWTVLDPQTWEVGVLTREEDVRALIGLLDRLITVGLDEPSKLLEVFKVVLGENLGEDASLFETRLDLELKARGLPLRDDSILAMTLAEIVAAPPPVRREWVKHVQARYEALVQAERQAQRDEFGNIVLPLKAIP